MIPANPSSVANNCIFSYNFNYWHCPAKYLYKEILHMNSNWHTQVMVDEINKQSERDALLKETHDTLLKMQEDSKKESAIESKRFIIQTVLSVASLIVAAIAAVASIIALL